MKKNLIKSIALFTTLVFMLSCGARKTKRANTIDDRISKIETMKEDDPSTSYDKKSKAKSKKIGGRGVKDKKEKPAKTWKKSGIISNTPKLSIGDKEQLPLKGMQMMVNIDGIRARVIIDCFYYNDKGRQLEGSFKLRLPNGASPYYLAFGQTVYLDNNKENIQFFNYLNKGKVKLSPSDLREMRKSSWTQPKEARIVPKEKASLAYKQTVQKRVDPALMEWSGADIFSARVFPLMPRKLHRVVIGYDVNLTQIKNDRVYELEYPKLKAPLKIDVQAAKINEKKPIITFKKKVKESNDFIHLTYKNPKKKKQSIQIRYSQINPLLTQTKKEKETFFSAAIKINLPQTKNNTSSDKAVFIVDTSLSSNPIKFNIWLKMIKAILTKNQSSIKKFAILFFNVETFWWKNKFVNNTTQNRTNLLKYMNTLTLEGATALDFALREAIKPSWAKSTLKYVDLFLLSDASITWGNRDLHVVANSLKNNRLFGYKTGITGTDNNALDQLARTSGGAIFSIAGEAEIKQASTAFKKQAWKIEKIKMNGTTDILIEGRPSVLYQGQPLLISGRGHIGKNSKLNLTLELNGKRKKLTVKFDKKVNSPLAFRTYGQIATNHLEEFGIYSEKFARHYATYFNVPGKTCSLLMLESEADYQRYNIKPEQDKYVISQSTVTGIIRKLIESVGEKLADAKANFMNYLNKLAKLQGVHLNLNTAFKMMLKKIPSSKFHVKIKGLNTKRKTKKNLSKKFLTSLKKRSFTYDSVTSQSKMRKKWSASDALKALSTLIEHNPSDALLLRDVGYSAMSWDLDAQAFYLFQRVAEIRPYEPQTYHAIAGTLRKMKKIEMAIIFYEIALNGQWNSRFMDFNNIVGMEYVSLLKKIIKGKYQVNILPFVKERYNELKSRYVKEADLVIMMAWNTDNTDMDLHVVEPTGEECYYSHRSTKIGGQMTRDVTQGYGPEMYILKKAPKGKFNIWVKYFASHQNRMSARTKVYAVIYKNWGRKNEQVIKKALTLGLNKEKHDILTLKVK